MYAPWSQLECIAVMFDEMDRKTETDVTYLTHIQGVPVVDRHL